MSPFGSEAIGISISEPASTPPSPSPPYPLLEVSQLLFPHHSLLPRYMATLHELSNFESLFQSALEEYEVQTEINLVRHPLAAQLESCNTVESITEVLQGQAQSFRELPEGNNKIVTLLKQTVQILHKLSAGVVLIESLSLVCRNC